MLKSHHKQQSNGPETNAGLTTQQIYALPNILGASIIKENVLLSKGIMCNCILSFKFLSQTLFYDIILQKDVI